MVKNKTPDGVPPGEYKAYLSEVPPQLQPAIPPQYRNREQTPWVVKVKKQDNTVDLVVQ